MFLDHDSGDCEKQRYIMFDNLPGGEHATEWSECSRGVIQRFLENEYVEECQTFDNLRLVLNATQA